MRSAMISDQIGGIQQDYDGGSPGTPSPGSQRGRGLRGGAELDSSDEDESTLNTSQELDGPARRTETFEEVVSV